MTLQTQGNIVANGTYLRNSEISMDFSTFMLVVIFYPLQPNVLLPFPLAKSISTIRESVGYEVLWPAQFLIDDENDEVSVTVIANFPS